jgi:ribosome recycling factor
MYKEIIDNIKPDLEKTIEYLKGELNKLRVGRATPAMVEDLEIECYGQKMSLKQLANISAPQPRLIVIQPWDKSILGVIEKGISQSSLGLAPIVDGDLIRITIPQLSEERRRELTKILSEKVEETRVSIRHKREEAWKEIQEGERAGEIREDDKFRGKDELQKVIDEYNEKVEEMRKNKESEIMTV